MKILFDHPSPFFLAHGGFQIQIEQTMAALTKIGVETEHVRWWDDTQKGDIIHYFGRPPIDYISLAHTKGMKVVLAELLTSQGSRPESLRKLQKSLTTIAKNCLPRSFTNRLAWESFKLADACVALTPWEGSLMIQMFDAPREKVSIVPNGVEDVFFKTDRQLERGKWLICTATITERKRVLEAAQAAVLAKIPLWIIGKPYSKDDAYAVAFQELAASKPEFIRYEGPISDRTVLARIYKQARGFVLLSTMESLSLSALEAVASGCPLLLSDLPWARCTFGNQANYCAITNSMNTAKVLRNFYDKAPELPVTFKPLTWVEVAQQLRNLYEKLITAPPPDKSRGAAGR